MLVYDALSFSPRRVICDSGSNNDFFKKMQSGDYDVNQLFRLFIADKIKNAYGNVRSMLDMLMEEYIPEEFAEYKAKLRASYDKRQEKIRAQLEELGYDVDGRKIEKS